MGREPPGARPLQFPLLLWFRSCITWGARDGSRFSFPAAVGTTIVTLPRLLERTPSPPLFWTLFYGRLCAGRRAPTLAENALDAASKDIPGPQTTGDVQPLLPALVFSPFSLVELLQPPIVLQGIVFVVEVEINTSPVKDSSRDLAPGTLPLVGASSVSCPAHARLGAREEVGSPACTLRGVSPCGRLRSPREFGPECVHALHAEPGAPRNAIKPDAVCMIGSVATVTQQEDLLLICAVADGARCGILLLFRVLVYPGLRVEFCNLFLVFDFVGRQKGSCNAGCQYLSVWS